MNTVTAELTFSEPDLSASEDNKPNYLVYQGIYCRSLSLAARIMEVSPRELRRAIIQDRREIHGKCFSFSSHRESERVIQFADPETREKRKENARMLKEEQRKRARTSTKNRVKRHLPKGASWKITVDGLTFYSACQASKYIGCHQSSLFTAINEGRNRIQGKEFDVSPVRRAPYVECVETGVLYNSFEDAAKTHGYEYRWFKNQIRKGQAVDGLHWNILHLPMTDEVPAVSVMSLGA